MRLRVVCGFLEVMETFSPRRRFIRVDFPTLGAPRRVTKPDLKLISDQELIAIQTIWYRDMNFHYRVSNIYQEVYQTDLNMKDSNEKFQQEEKLLRESCKKHPEDFQLIQDLLKLQRNKALLNKKRGLKDDIENRIEKHIKDFSK